MLKTVSRLAACLFLIAAIGGCQQEIGSQNPNAPPAGQAPAHDAADPYSTSGGAGGGAAGSHAQ